MTSDGDARAFILATIRKAVGDGSRPPSPSPSLSASDASGDPTAATSVDREFLARRFKQELEAVGGDVRFVYDRDDLPDAIAACVTELGAGAVSTDFSAAGYAILHAEALLADTGSAIVIERSAARRLAPYLPRTCIIVGDASVLYPAMTPASLDAIFAAARARDRGEAIIITGPSRTADIEKTLVLGAHGPKTLVAFITGVAPAEGMASRDGTP